MRCCSQECHDVLPNSGNKCEKVGFYCKKTNQKYRFKKSNTVWSNLECVKNEMIVTGKNNIMLLEVRRTVKC